MRQERFWWEGEVKTGKEGVQAPMLQLLSSSVERRVGTLKRCMIEG